MDTIDAIMIIETETGADYRDELEAWSTLIASGAVWSLQGFYGRGASGLIDAGFIDETGVIDWPLVEERLAAC